MARLNQSGGVPRFRSRHSSHRGCALLWFALFLPALLSGCNNTHANDEPGTVNFLIESSPTNLDPRVGTDAQSEHLDGLIFNSLVAHDAQMNITPDLAESWDQPNPLTYIFHLRHGVKFHNGRPFTSADVKFTFDSMLSGSIKTVKRGGSFSLVESIDAPDAFTVVFHLREAYASFLWSMTRPAIGVVPQGSDKNFGQHPIGTGPFQFVSMVPDDNIVLDRNPHYFGDGSAPTSTTASVTAAPTAEKPAADAPTPGSLIQRIRVRIVPDAIVRALELRKGTADISAVNSLTPDMVVALGKQPGIVVDKQPGTTLAYVAMNFDDPIVGHREVRQALAYGTDRESLVKYLLRGQARLAASLLPPGHWAYDPATPQYNFDPARAEKLLDAAGFPRRADGSRFHLQIKTSTDESTRLLSEALADQWKNIGIALDLRPLESATFFSDITRGSFQMYSLRWIGVNNDPDVFDFVFNSKKMPPDGADRGHYKNPALDALLAQERVETDLTKRKIILSQIQKIVAEDEPYINLWFPDNVCAHRARVTGIVIPPAGDLDFLVQARLQQ